MTIVPVITNFQKKKKVPVITSDAGGDVKERRYVMTPKFLQLNVLAPSQVVHSTLVLPLQAIQLEQMLCEREIVNL